MIDLDLEFTEKRIVVDAKINKHVNSKNGFARVSISKTTSYFDDEITLTYAGSTRVAQITDIDTKQGGQTYLFTLLVRF